MNDNWECDVIFEICVLIRTVILDIIYCSKVSYATQKRLKLTHPDYTIFKQGSPLKFFRSSFQSEHCVPHPFFGIYQSAQN